MERNVLEIVDVEISDYRIDYNIKISGKWKEFLTGYPFFVEYNQYIGDIPKSVAVIPILGTLLQVAWIYDLEIIVRELDEEFHKCVSEIKQGYIDMYPQIEFKGIINVKRLIKNVVDTQKNVACLFSGGVDAFETLLTHFSEKPKLISIWGADIDVENEKAWNIVQAHIKKIAYSNKLDSLIIKSSLRKVLEEGKLYKDMMRLTGDGWWHGFHHGIGMLCLAAPLACVLDLSKIYIASSYTKNDAVPCASSPTIDNYVKYVNCQIIHDGYEYNRIEKIKRICDYAKQNNMNIELRVCWESQEGNNCCRCEKCWRTILAIYALKENPHDYGFVYDKKELCEMIYNFKYGSVSPLAFGFYIDIQKELRKNYTIKEVHPKLKWFYKADLLMFEALSFRKKNILRKAIRFLERIQFM